MEWGGAADGWADLSERPHLAGLSCLSFGPGWVPFTGARLPDCVALSMGLMQPSLTPQDSEGHATTYDSNTNEVWMTIKMTVGSSSHWLVAGWWSDAVKVTIRFHSHWLVAGRVEAHREGRVPFCPSCCLWTFTGHQLLRKIRVVAQSHTECPPLVGGGCAESSGPRKMWLSSNDPVGASRHNHVPAFSPSFHLKRKSSLYKIWA